MLDFNYLIVLILFGIILYKIGKSINTNQRNDPIITTPNQNIKPNNIYSNNSDQDGGSGNQNLSSGGQHLSVGTPFSYLNQDISFGNPVSWSGYVNPYVNKDRFFDCNKPIYVYQGTPNPLPREMKPMTIPKDSMFYFANAIAAPECCPSPYSTSTGCVCMGPKNITPCNTEKPTDWPILNTPISEDNVALDN